METLYRKYRPQNFAEAVGQNHIKLTLEHEIETGKLAHAYLFCGPRAVGKTTFSRLLAKSLNCEQRKAGEHEPCNKCVSCLDITAGKSLDIIEIDAASHTGVENVRENIIASARVAPARSRYKVFIIDEVHMLSVSAFNALLKIIEEPPAFVVFVLCTTEIHKVPATIISRCQRFDFKRISVSDIVRKLEYITKTEGIKIKKEILEAIARHSEGHMRDAESLLGQVVSIGGNEISQEEADLVIPRSDWGEAVNLLGLLSKKDTAGGIRLVNKLLDEGLDLKVFLSDAIELLRKLLLVKINPGLSEKLGLELGESLELKMNEISKELSLEVIISALEEFIRAKNESKTSGIQQLPVELALVRLSLAGQTHAFVKEVFAPVPAPKGAFKPAVPAVSAAPSKPASKPGGVLKKENILAKWNEVLASVKKYNHSLSFILRVCQPKDIDGNQVCLAFKYKFHKDRINEPGIRAIVEKVFNEVYGLPLTVEAVIDENMEVADNSDEISVQPAAQGQTDAEGKKEGDNSEIIDNLLKTFGGKIVE